jgi:hypothetical protein
MSLDGINLQGHALKVRRPKDYVPTAGEEHIADPTVPNSDGCKYLPYKETISNESGSMSREDFFHAVNFGLLTVISIFSYRTCGQHCQYQRRGHPE